MCWLFESTRKILPPQMRKILIIDHNLVHDVCFTLSACWNCLPWVCIFDLLDVDANGWPWVLSRSCTSHDIRTSCCLRSTGWPNTTTRTAPTTVYLFRDWCCIWNWKSKNKYNYWIVGAYYIKKLSDCISSMFKIILFNTYPP